MLSSSSSASNQWSSGCHHKDIIILKYKEFVVSTIKFHLIFIIAVNEII